MRELPCRSQEAQALHTAILGFIQGEEGCDSDAILRLIRPTSGITSCRDFIVELSSSGHSHLIDILHLPFAFHPSDPTLARERCLHLFQLFLQHLPMLEWASLLVQSTQEGFTPLHSTLKSGSPEIVTAYLAQVKQAQHEGYLTREAVGRLLIAANEARFTPLHEALISGNPEIVTAYLAQVKQAQHEGYLTQEAVGRLLVAANQAGFTPLHQALKSGNPEIVTAYLAQVKQAQHEGYLTQEAVGQLLAAPNQAGFTPLHDALKSGNPEIVTAYLAQVKQAQHEGYLTQEAVGQLLAAPNQTGFTPLHDALKSGNPEIVTAYLAQVKQAQHEGYLTQEAVGQLLVAPNQAGFTPLHDALISGNPEIVMAYLAQVKQAQHERYLTEKAVGQLLVAPNQAGFTPLHQVLKSGNPEIVTAYLAQVKQAQHEGYLTQEAVRRLLVAPNQAGFTPLHQALISRLAFSVDVLLKLLGDFLDPHELKAALLGCNTAKYNIFHQAAYAGDAAILNTLIEFIQRRFPESADSLLHHLANQKNNAGRFPFSSSSSREVEDLLSFCRGRAPTKRIREEDGFGRNEDSKRRRVEEDRRGAAYSGNLGYAERDRDSHSSDARGYDSRTDASFFPAPRTGRVLHKDDNFHGEAKRYPYDRN